MNCCLVNNPTSATYLVLVSLWNGITLIGSVVANIVHNSAATEPVAIPFAFSIVGNPSTTYNFNIGINAAVNGVAIGVGCYYASSTNLKPLYKSSANNVTTDSNYSIVAAVSTNNQVCGLCSGYTIIEHV